MIRCIDTTFCQSLRERPLDISYVDKAAKKLINTGHTVQVTVEGSDSSALVRIRLCLAAQCRDVVRPSA